MKKFFFMFLFCFCYAALFSDNADIEYPVSSSFFPLNLGNVLYYKGYKTGEPEKLLKIRADVASIENVEGVDYYFFNAPSADIRYLIRKDKDAVLLKLMRFPFPIFNFSVSAVFYPEFLMLKFPILKGRKWHYEGKAKAKIFGIFTITRDVTADFEVVRREKVITDAGRLDTYHVIMRVDEGDGQGIKTYKYWYAKNIGFAISNTDADKCELVGYVVKSDVDGIVRKKIPEREEEYK
ncbi:MAG: hypothetical protein KA120_07415 [Candidatus Goldbacteria bacterium]|nr:hypothetical protein [Candidatus Goldiibacteriota bacterium]